MARPGSAGAVAAAHRARRGPRATGGGGRQRPRSAPSARPREAQRDSVARRAALEDCPRYLWRFGFGRGGSDPVLQICASGHVEEDGHTRYILDLSLRPSTQEGSVPSCTWQCKRRLAELRELLHDPVKEAMGVEYRRHFADHPFAHHGGPPGTTARLGGWLSALSACVSRGILAPPLCASVLRALDAPVPAGSDAALLQAAGRCVVCTLPVSSEEQAGIAGSELCERCLVKRDPPVQKQAE